MGIQVATADDRNVWGAMWTGMRLRCPHCGEGKLFRGYLKVNDACPHCGEELHHHRADDLPPYLAILVVGHVIVGVMLHMEMTMQVSPVTYLVTLLPLALVTPLITLPSIKGAVVGLQWAMRMHGFDSFHRDPAEPDQL